MCKAASHSKVALTVFLTNPLKYSHTKKPALFLLWSVNALIMKSENSLRILKLHFSYCFVENLVRFLLYIILLHYIIQFLAVFLSVVINIYFSKPPVNFLVLGLTCKIILKNNFKLISFKIMSKRLPELIFVDFRSF